MAYWNLLSFLSCQFEFHRFQCIKHIVITKDMVNNQQKQYANANIQERHLYINKDLLFFCEILLP